MTSPLPWTNQLGWSVGSESGSKKLMQKHFSLECSQNLSFMFHIQPEVHLLAVISDIIAGIESVTGQGGRTDRSEG